MATSSVSLGTSNLRSAPRPTRVNSSRALRTARSSLRQNFPVSNTAASTQGLHEPQGFYPAITSFTDAIAAVPRDYRRHISLLKEVDAKAWYPEENLQKIIAQCIVERETQPNVSDTDTIAGSTANLADTFNIPSATASINGMTLDNISQYSSQSANPVVQQRRQLYAALRHNLMQMMITMDEKNHVINNANEDLSRHIRRLDNVWPHIAEELSEEARLGSLKHWAYTETNPIVKKPTAASSRRETAASLGIMADNDITHRSESRREAMLARKQRLNQQVDSDFDDKAGRRGTVSNKSRKNEGFPEIVTSTAVPGAGKKKAVRGLGGVAMERVTSVRAGGTAMSREPSQQDNAKKRKAPATASVAARKRLNPGAQESPKLASSPLLSLTGKDAVKRSPALAAVRPVARARQNSAQSDTVRHKTSSSAMRNIANSSATDLGTVMAATGRSAPEVKATMKEYKNSRGDKLVEDGTPVNGESVRGGILLERTTSRQGGLKREALNAEQSVRSPRLGTSTLAHEGKIGRGRSSKVSTPVIGSFDDAEAETSATGNGSENGGSMSMGAKAKRAPRARIKDHHGLQDSLSPKGLPMKRAHTKTASMSSLNALSLTRKPSSSRARDRDRQPENEETSAMLSRSNSRSNNQTASHSTPSNSQPPTTQGGDQSSEDENDPTDADIDEDARYCLCNGPSYGEMVACDNKNCPREWFHLGCIGLKRLPSAAKWYCDECKEELTRKGRFAG